VPLASSTFEALGTSAQVTVTDAAVLPAAVSIVRRELRAIDLACSRFRDDSELSALNRSGGRPFAASALLVEALSVAAHAAEETDGDVDPTVGRALNALGWDADFVIVVSRDMPRRVEAVPAQGWRSLRIDRERGIVRLPAGVQIDLGATAKALAADRSAAAVARSTGAGVLVSLGGDVAVAGTAPARGWTIRVTDDHRSGPSGDGQTIALRFGGLATSSTAVRRWSAGGAERHHIVDPRTGLECPEVWRTVSVAAESCVAANTASTAAIVRGGAAVAWLEGANLCARLVDPTGAIARTGGWPEDDA
jgi:thiamine biosynthesis lipoprotein ApbE